MGRCLEIYFYYPKLGHSTITAELSNLIINHETCLSNTFLDLYEGNHYQEAIHIGKECLQNQFISDSELADIHTLLAQCYQKLYGESSC